MLAEPQNNLDFRRELPDDGVKAAPGMDELRASADDRCDDYVFTRAADRLDDAVLHQLSAHWHTRKVTAN